MCSAKLCYNPPSPEYSDVITVMVKACQRRCPMVYDVAADINLSKIQSFVVSQGTKKFKLGSIQKNRKLASTWWTLMAWWRKGVVIWIISFCLSIIFYMYKMTPLYVSIIYQYTQGVWQCKIKMKKSNTASISSQLQFVGRPLKYQSPRLSINDDISIILYIDQLSLSARIAPNQMSLDHKFPHTITQTLSRPDIALWRQR